jgi:hypothetical protein
MERITLTWRNLWFQELRLGSRDSGDRALTTNILSCRGTAPYIASARYSERQADIEQSHCNQSDVQFGGQFRYFSRADRLTNWVQAASYAACVDLSPVFYDRWGFPRPDGTVTPRPAADTVPEPPSGTCAVTIR